MAEEDAKARPLRFAWYGRLSTEELQQPDLGIPLAASGMRSPHPWDWGNRLRIQRRSVGQIL
jgi:hypothetical protein